jgi:CRP-like cAMP-binding protein
MFGTVALFTDGLYPADAVTLADTTEASWSEADLLELMGRCPRIAINMIRIIGKRLQEVQERLREASTQRAAQRVARAVLRLAQQAGHDTLDGTAIEFPLRRRDVADISGTTLYTASRILTGWEKAGLLASQNRRLTVHRPAEILRIAENSGS